MAGDTIERMVARETDFVCAICDRSVDMRWNSVGVNEVIPPLCRYCETHYGPRSRTLDGAGTFRDRRIVIQSLALAEALNGHAHVRLWGQESGHAAS